MGQEVKQEMRKQRGKEMKIATGESNKKKYNMRKMKIYRKYHI